jgi:hypothetical protein
MKLHLTKEQCFKNFMKRNKDGESQRAAFYAGWYSAGSQINEGEDSDWLSESLHENDFIVYGEAYDE